MQTVTAHNVVSLVWNNLAPDIVPELSLRTGRAKVRRTPEQVR